MYEQKTLFGDKIIKSISFDEQEIIRDILYLHCNNQNIELDPTYSIGNFYKKGLHQPKYKFDLHPQSKDIEESCSTNLPLNNNSINIIIFDPPFMFGKHGKTDQNIMNKRFSMYNKWEDLEWHYKNSLLEFVRILKLNGILIFKCQDYTDNKTTFTHIYVHNWSQNCGFYVKDLFVLLSRGAIINKSLKQRHARKYHSYFWVLKKTKIIENILTGKDRSI